MILGMNDETKQRANLEELQSLWEKRPTCPEGGGAVQPGSAHQQLCRSGVEAQQGDALCRFAEIGSAAPQPYPRLTLRRMLMKMLGRCSKTSTATHWATAGAPPVIPSGQRSRGIIRA
jgi:hypothetical protein